MVHCSGLAVITFDHAEEAAACVRAHAKTRPTRVHGGGRGGGTQELDLSRMVVGSDGEGLHQHRREEQLNLNPNAQTPTITEDLTYGQGVTVAGTHVVCSSVPWGPEDVRWDRIGNGPLTMCSGVIVALLSCSLCVLVGTLLLSQMEFQRRNASTGSGTILCLLAAAVILVVDKLATMVSNKNQG